MSTMKEFLKLEPKKLQEKLQELKGRLFVLRFQIANGKTNKYSDVRKLKVQIAQVLTIFNQYQVKKKVAS